MPKGRMLNKKISYDEKVALLSIEATLLYTWCIPHLDVKGRIYGDSNILKGMVAPYVKELNPQKIDKCIVEMEEQSLITYYGNEHKYIEFKGFSKNQTLRENRESSSEIPEPAELLSNSNKTPAQVKLSKVKLSKDKLILMSFPEFENDILSNWNSLATKHPLLSKVQKITPERRKHLKSRYENNDFLGKYKNILDVEYAKNPFLFGHNDRKWISSFDWFIRNDENYVKILEGKYKK